MIMCVHVSVHECVFARVFTCAPYPRLDLLPASGGEEMTKGFLKELVNILLHYICKSSQRSSKVLNCFFQQDK